MYIPPFWGSPTKQDLRSNSALFWAPLLILPPVLDPPGGRGYVATLPTSGPLLILPLALKPWGSPRRQGLRSYLAHKWATFDFAPRSEAVRIPQAVGVM